MAVSNLSTLDYDLFSLGGFLRGLRGGGAGKKQANESPTKWREGCLREVCVDNSGNWREYFRGFLRDFFYTVKLQ